MRKIFILTIISFLLVFGEITIMDCNSIDTGKKECPSNKSVKSFFEKLCDNQYNKIGLPTGDSKKISTIMQKLKNLNREDLLKKLNAEDITLQEASWGMYYLGLKYLQEEKNQEAIKYWLIASDDYLNPWALVKISKLYYYDKETFKKSFPNSEFSTNRDYKKSFYYLILAFQIASFIEKEQNNKEIFNGVISSGLGLFDTYNANENLVTNSDRNAANEEAIKKTQIFIKMYS